jgi:hypothetical protein
MVHGLKNSGPSSTGRTLWLTGPTDALMLQTANSIRSGGRYQMERPSISSSNPGAFGRVQAEGHFGWHPAVPAPRTIQCSINVFHSRFG